MFELDIPGFGQVRLDYLVSDYTGTLSQDGFLLPGVRDRLNAIAEFMNVHILTADTFGKVKSELQDTPCIISILSGKNLDTQKEDYIRKLDARKVIAFGNGNNDRLMLKTARIGMAVSQGEGCSAQALVAADIHVTDACIGLDLLLNPKRLQATLRF